jgi:hypothetical protein
MALKDKIFNNPRNEKILTFLSLTDNLELIKTNQKDGWEAYGHLWELSVNISEDTKYYLGTTALLIHPKTALIFGFGYGRFCIGIRQPNYIRPIDAEKNEGRQVIESLDGVDFDLSQAGNDWIVGACLRDGAEQTLKAFELAGQPF